MNTAIRAPLNNQPSKRAPKTHQTVPYRGRQRIHIHRWMSPHSVWAIIFTASEPTTVDMDRAAFVAASATLTASWETMQKCRPVQCQRKL